jgi:L-asparaginase/Glu-tRNA(Gln) amidotransferase subunit D
MNITLIYTGGTIGGICRTSGPVQRDHDAASFSALLKPRLAREGIRDMPTVEPILGKLSENIVPEDWSALARLIDRHVREGVGGIVVAHGTDTLVYTACALHWLLKGVPVPVVLTASRIPLEARRSDAARNVAHALRVAQCRRRPGVWICFGGQPGGGSLVLEPGRAVKEAGRTDCFQPVLEAPAGKVRASDGRVTWRKAASGALPYCPRFEVDPKVALFTVHPGFRPELISGAINGGARGIVLAGYGSGTACVSPGPFDLRAAVRAAVKAGVPVWLVSQHRGRVAMDYGSTEALVKAGACLKPDLTPEAAVTALMCSGSGVGRLR